MSTASNTIETRFFTLFVPPVVAVYVPHRMVGSGRAASLTVPVVGGLLFLVGAIGYFCCAVLFVQAQGTPRAHQPDQAARLSPARIASIATLCTLPCSPLSLDSRRSTNAPPLRSMVYFLFACFHLFVVLCEERTLRTQFDGEYEDLCRRVPRWIPRLKS